VLIVPPGRGAFQKKRPHVKVAQFDIVLLIEFTSLEAAHRFKDMPRWQETLAIAKLSARKFVSMEA
jgi:hypothetical protein